ncbi:hypothetical protein BDP27DRAFT_1366593 [Rhodocollybia butyracea]|uniref:Uncharacterized protein n=1 Tax=Rhodocollybia butyracea TaxID=206335 RepID=A0A9P5U447_9AGAR|nr:hypothetical protein BDP27DRAFT_1366593 [Rhodocollybia butyracea]
MPPLKKGLRVSPPMWTWAHLTVLITVANPFAIPRGSHLKIACAFVDTVPPNAAGDLVPRPTHINTWSAVLVLCRDACQKTARSRGGCRPMSAVRIRWPSSDICQARKKHARDTDSQPEPTSAKAVGTKQTNDMKIAREPGSFILLLAGLSIINLAVYTKIGLTI